MNFLEEIWEDPKLLRSAAALGAFLTLNGNNKIYYSVL